MVDKAREAALKVLYKIEKEDAYSNIALDEEIKENKQNLISKDIGLISEIVYGVTTWRLTLDTIIEKYSKIKLKKISCWILNILRMGIYQIIFLDKIPKSAAVNEAVNLAKRYGHKSSSNFVNAILRKITKRDYEELFDIENDIERISKTTSMPQWIIEELLKEKDVNEVNEIAKCSNIKPKVAIRVNTLKTSKLNLKETLKNKNIKCNDGVLNDFLILEKLKGIEHLDIFEQGLFTVQDEAAGLVAVVLDPKEGQKVLDACSAPGGKTTYMAQLMNNKGEIDAWDIHLHRTNLVEKTAKRLGIDIIQTKLQDATIYKEEYKEKFDRILLDVPCLGIGVMKRKPDIKWKKSKEDVSEIVKIQEKILDTCSKYLKVGGELVYSTCSILLEENERIIEKFLQKNSNFECEKLNLDKQKYFIRYLEGNSYIKVYPNQETDGFFICKLKRK